MILPAAGTTEEVATNLPAASTSAAATVTREQSPGTHRPHMPALDGLRGIAVLLVVLHHTLGDMRPVGAVSAIVQRLAGAGWIGVDLFFALSGFLITGILLDTRGKPGYFRNFMVRRALRILPLYAVFVALVILVLPAIGVLPEERVAQPRRHAEWFALMVPNVLLAVRGWDAGGDLSHLWSIGIEEQFYLVWPLVVALVAPRRFALVTLGVAALAPALRMGAASLGATPLAIYTLMPTHLDGLVLGAFAAAIHRSAPPGGALARIAALTAIPAALVLVAVALRGTFSWGERPMWLVGYSALAVVAAACVLAAARAARGSWADRVLGSRALHVFGKYSYSLYLFHQLVRLGVLGLGPRVGMPSRVEEASPAAVVALTLVVIILSLLVAMLTWRIVERPALALKRYFPD